MPSILYSLPPDKRRQLVDLRHQAECAEQHATELKGEAKAETLAYARRCRALYLALHPNNGLANWR